MLIKTTILSKYNPQLNEYDGCECVLVDVPEEKIAKVMAKKFRVDKEKMYDILMDIYDCMDFDSYFEDNEEIQNLAREFYDCEECEQ